MKLLLHSPTKALNKAYLGQSLRRDQIDLFKSGLGRMFERIRTDEYEEHLPIPPAAQKTPIIEGVRKILAAPGSSDVETQNFASLQEAEIALLVYALYGLTDAEIAVVEGKA